MGGGAQMGMRTTLASCDGMFLSRTSAQGSLPQALVLAQRNSHRVECRGSLHLCEQNLRNHRRGQMWR